MKYAVISDLHGNLPALEYALEDARANGADVFLFTGDYCTSAPWGSAIVDRLRSLPNAQYVRGNEERYLHLPQGDDGQFEVTYWSSRQLRPEQLDWLDRLPENLTLDCEGVRLHLAHSSKAFIGSAEEGMCTWKLPLRYPDGPVDRRRFLQDVRRTLTDSMDFQQSLRTLPKGVYLFGHTHSQWHMRFGDHLFLNPGSCGLNLDCSALGAAYTLLTVENGACRVEERRPVYDVEALIDQVKRSGQYAAARVWSELIFEEWRTGRERVCFFLHHAEQFAQSIGDSRRPFAKDTWERAYELWKKQKHP